MTALRIQQYLRAQGRDHESAFAELLNLYGIKAKRHARHSSLVLFKYDQIASPFAEEIVRECRGIVLDEVNDWRVVSRSFSKFFNHGEGHAAPIDWSTARVQEKVDGSLATLYPYAGEWHVATTGTPDASGDVNGFGVTFADLFWRTFREGGHRVPPIDCAHSIYFELTGPMNRIVVQHAEPSLTLLGARCLRTQQEIRPAEAEARWGIGARVVPEYPLQSFDEIAASFETMSPLAQEGYVVVDAAFNRVKVKHPGYVALHHAKGGLSRKAFVHIARSGESAEVIVAFPEFAPMLDDARARLAALASELEADYSRIESIPEQKAFAIEALKSRCSAALFQVRAKKAASVPEFLRAFRLDSLTELLGYTRVEAETPTATEDA